MGVSFRFPQKNHGSSPIFPARRQFYHPTNVSWALPMFRKASDTLLVTAMNSWRCPWGIFGKRWQNTWKFHVYIIYPSYYHFIAINIIIISIVLIIIINRYDCCYQVSMKNIESNLKKSTVTVITSLDTWGLTPNLPEKQTWNCWQGPADSLNILMFVGWVPNICR